MDSKTVPRLSQLEDLIGMSTSEVLARFTDGPQTGVFTDGASEGNPGPGGWGAVLVVDDQMVSQDYGSEGHRTTGLRVTPPTIAWSSGR